MLSLLLGFAQAHVKNTIHKQKPTFVSDKAFYLDPKAMEPFISKDPRYIKVYSPKETSVANGGGVTRAFVANNVAYLYLDDDYTRAICAGASLVSAVSRFIPNPFVSRVVGAVCTISSKAIGYTNHGRGVVFRVPLGWGFPSLYAQ